MNSNNSIHAVLVGAGPLGINIYKHALKRSDIKITQVVDIEPLLKGKDMGAHSGLEPTGILIQDKIAENGNVSVAILATVSDLPRIGPQLLTLIEAGLCVVSTCEEMFFSLGQFKRLV
jgi:hypothetical protein